MRITLITTILLTASVIQAQVNMGGGSDNARRLWKSGVSSVVSGNNEMARSLWKRCYEADPRNQDCRAGLILLGHEELLQETDMSGYTPPKEHVMPKGAKAKISGRVDKKSAQKNWNLGLQKFQKGDVRGARDFWTRCLELDPGNADCGNGLRRIGGSAGRTKGDVKAAGKHYNAGMKYLMSGQKAKAKQSFMACLKADPNHRDCSKGLKRAR